MAYLYQPPSNNPYIPQTTFPAPNAVTPFEQVLPFDRVFDPTLINQLAESQLRPDLDRQQYEASRNLERNLANTGGFRLGSANVSRTNLSDAYARALAEQSGAFTGQVKDWVTDWYNRQYQSYYQNPARFTLPQLPTFENYAREKGISGPSTTGVPYKSPFKIASTGAMYLPGAYSAATGNNRAPTLNAGEEFYRPQPFMK